MIRFKAYLKEDHYSTQEEYDQVLNTLYGDDPEFIKYAKYCDEQIIKMYGIKPMIRSSGNVFVKYAEKEIDGQWTIFVLGMLSEKGKLLKTDIPDVKLWMDRLEKTIKNGSYLITSANKYSKPFLIKMIKKNGFKMEVQGSITKNDDTWETLIIHA